MTEEYRNQVWYGMLDAERVSRYYMAIAEKMTRRHFIVTIFVVFAAASVSGGLLTNIPSQFVISLAAALAFVAIWSSYCDYSRKAAAAAMIADGCRDISLRWRRLWITQDRYLKDGYLPEIGELEREMDRVTSSREIAWLQLPTDHRINEKCAEEAYSAVEQEFKEPAKAV